MRSEALKIYIAHRLNYDGDMYADVVDLLRAAKTGGYLHYWRDLTMKPDVCYRNPDGSRKSASELAAYAAVRIDDSDVLVLVDRPAADFGEFLPKELRIAQDKGGPVVLIADPSVQRTSTLVDEIRLVYEYAEWDPQRVAAAIYRAIRTQSRRR